MRDDCVMTMVLCPYEEAGCTFHVSYVIILQFGIHFVVEMIHLANHKGKRLNQVKHKVNIHEAGSNRGKTFENELPLVLF